MLNKLLLCIQKLQIKREIFLAVLYQQIYTLWQHQVLHRLASIQIIVQIF